MNSQFFGILLGTFLFAPVCFLVSIPLFLLTYYYFDLPLVYCLLSCYFLCCYMASALSYLKVSRTNAQLTKNPSLFFDNLKISFAFFFFVCILSSFFVSIFHTSSFFSFLFLFFVFSIQIFFVTLCCAFL